MVEVGWVLPSQVESVTAIHRSGCECLNQTECFRVNSVFVWCHVVLTKILGRSEIIHWLFSHLESEVVGASAYCFLPMLPQDKRQGMSSIEKLRAGVLSASPQLPSCFQ